MVEDLSPYLRGWQGYFGQHIHEHIDQFIATRVGLRDGRLIDFTNGRCLPLNGLRHQELYVDPRSGLIRLTNIDSDWKRDRAERRRHNAAIIQSQHKPLTVDGNETSLRAEQVSHVPFFKVFSWRWLAEKRDDILAAVTNEPV